MINPALFGIPMFNEAEACDAEEANLRALPHRYVVGVGIACLLVSLIAAFV